MWIDGVYFIETLFFLINYIFWLPFTDSFSKNQLYNKAIKSSEDEARDMRLKIKPAIQRQPKTSL